MPNFEKKKKKRKQKKKGKKEGVGLRAKNQLEANVVKKSPPANFFSRLNLSLSPSAPSSPLM